jgi:multidrug efflux pump subunit AcrA (membrane-fusion protein)
MTVDTALVGRREISEAITVVGNLIGEQTVDVAPRVGGRIETINVKLGDRVTRGQQVAKMEDRDIREQVNQATASLDVNKATVRSRESDLKSADTTAQRQRTMFATGLTLSRTSTTRRPATTRRSRRSTWQRRSWRRHAGAARRG